MPRLNLLNVLLVQKKCFEPILHCLLLQESFAQKCFSLIDEYAPGFSSSIVGYDMLTPPDLEREFGLTGNVPLDPRSV